MAKGPLTTMATSRRPHRTIINCDLPDFMDTQNNIENSFTYPWKPHRFLRPVKELFLSSNDAADLCTSVDLDTLVVETLPDFEVLTKTIQSKALLL